MKQNKYSDLEVSDLLKEKANVDELDRHVYYTAKVIRRLTLSEAKLSLTKPRISSDVVTIFNAFKRFASISEAKVSKDLSNITNSSLPYIFSKFSLTL
jgi:hypothetical protein